MPELGTLNRRAGRRPGRPLSRTTATAATGPANAASAVWPGRSITPGFFTWRHLSWPAATITCSSRFGDRLIAPVNLPKSPSPPSCGTLIILMNHLLKNPNFTLETLNTVAAVKKSLPLSRIWRGSRFPFFLRPGDSAVKLPFPSLRHFLNCTRQMPCQNSFKMSP